MRALLSFVLSLVLSAPAAFADAPKPWQMNFQEPASVGMERIVAFHNELLWLITFTSVFVMLLLAYVMIRFRASKNPVPSTTTHHTLLEVIWTAIPVIILIVIAVPSIKLLYFTDKIENPDMTLKVIGHQWYWEYVYPDNGDINFDSYMIKDKDLKPGQLRLLEVDNRIVLPVHTKIRVETTAADVIHSWAVPALGIKVDTVPGRLNEKWIEITHEGVYRGQCSELCGAYHGFMPIVVEAVSKEKFQQWVESKSKKPVAGAATPAEKTPATKTN
ncbi:MAG: cytochrome c oxidase subunit II [Proteobacteria bacterium]|nr:cytochrome c oxidase subunit II [Pseudomonadota bacterium]